MATVTLRPTSTVSEYQTWTPTGGAPNTWTALDASGATAAKAERVDDHPYGIYTFADVSLPLYSVITSVQFAVNWSGEPHNGVWPNAIVAARESDGSPNITQISRTFNQLGTFGDTSPVRLTDLNGSAWTEAYINDMQLWLQSLGGSGANKPIMYFYEIYAVVTYNLIPNAPVVTVPAVVREDVPVSWVHSDPESNAQDGYMTKIYASSVVNGGGFNPDTSDPYLYYNSISSGASSETIDINLPDGRFYVYMRTRGVGNGNWGAWAGSAEFRVANDPVMMI